MGDQIGSHLFTVAPSASVMFHARLPRCAGNSRGSFGLRLDDGHPDLLSKGLHRHAERPSPNGYNGGAEDKTKSCCDFDDCLSVMAARLLECLSETMVARLQQ